MTTEEKLKELILQRYHSIREFTISIDMPNSTLESILSRGVDKASVTNVIKICKALGISADALADGEIKPIYNKKAFFPNDRIEVKEILDETKDILNHCGFVTLDGNPLSQKGIESIIDAMDVGVEMAKKKN